jgi:hypothetical protein
VRATVAGLKKGDKVSAVLKVGYSVGYPVSVFPDGMKLTMNTPSLSLSGQADASLNPNISINPSGGGGSIGQIGGQVGSQATLIPSHQVTASVAPGGVRDIVVSQFNLTGLAAEISLTDGHMSFTNAAGPVMLRPFARLSIVTSSGIYELELHNTHSPDVAV